MCGVKLKNPPRHTHCTFDTTSVNYYGNFYAADGIPYRRVFELPGRGPWRDNFPTLNKAKNIFMNRTQSPKSLRLSNCDSYYSYFLLVSASKLIKFCETIPVSAFPTPKMGKKLTHIIEGRVEGKKLYF